MRKVWQKRMKERVNKFFQMSPKEQNKYLDERIARRDRWRKAREARRRAQGDNNNNRSRNNSNSNNSDSNRRRNRSARRQGFLENTDSTTRAQMMEIHRRMRKRRKQTRK